jgi:hypothetical protein
MNPESVIDTVIRQQAAHSMRIQAMRNQAIDTTTVVDTLTYLISRFGAHTVVSEALLTALLSIEADIDAAMKAGH